LSGGQINMEVGTTNFGRYGLIADGKSNTAIFTATANGAASTNATTFAINAPAAAGSWFGDATRPALNMLVQVSGNLYPILSATANGAGWNVVISRPNPSNRAENLGLISGHSNGAAVSFFLRSMISTASHTHEYTGAGTSYLAMPENGGVPIEANESVNLNNGRVWLSSVDQNGKFKVGDTFVVDQQTGFVTIDPNSYSTNLVSDLSPELGGDLDVLTRNIYSSVGDIGIQDAFNTGVNLMLVRESSLSTAYPFVTQYDIGTDPNQVPLNGFLGTMAFQDSAGVNVDLAAITQISNVPLLTGGGLKFPATQVASADPNTLDDYEEGTWTPNIVNTGYTYTYSNQTGTYTKVGRKVTLSWRVKVTARSGSASGGFPVVALPFTPSASFTGSSPDAPNPAQLVIHKASTSSSAGIRTFLYSGLANGNTTYFWIAAIDTSSNSFDLGADFQMGGVFVYEV
jgi:hypothetical protein